MTGPRSMQMWRARNASLLGKPFIAQPHPVAKGGGSDSMFALVLAGQFLLLILALAHP